MNKIERILFISIFALLLLLCGSICINVWQHFRYLEVTELVRTDTVIRTDTIYSERVDTVPTVVAENTIGHVNISDILSHDNSVVSQKDENLNTNPSENYAQKDDDFMRDSLPIVQKTYADSTYTAYVSGIKYGSYPSLDSLRIKERTIYQTVTITKDLRQRQKRFHVGVIGGYGYGFTSKCAEPYIGIGVGYSLFSF